VLAGGPTFVWPALTPLRWWFFLPHRPPGLAAGCYDAVRLSRTGVAAACGGRCGRAAHPAPPARCSHN